MHRLVLLSALLLTTVPALADPGHLAHERGHAHWIALAAAGAALLIAIGYYLRASAARRRNSASAPNR